jgi:hypothetical protein
MKTRYLILSLTMMSFWSGVDASQQQASTPTAAETQTILKQSAVLKRSSNKVGVCMRRIAIQMASILDANAQYHTNDTMRETVQELSDRLRQAIEKYERAKNVKVILYYKDCGVDDVTDDFIHTIFPYPAAE